LSWETEEQERGWTRREWVRLGLTAASIGTVAGLGGLVAGQILPPPYKIEGEIRETIHYTKFPTPQWWNGRRGSPVRVSDFQVWQGATGVWRGLYQNGIYVPGTGLPVLIIRVLREDQFFTVPAPEEMPAELPDGYSLYFDDPTLDAANGGTRLVVLFDRCVHLCCTPGWHVVDNPPPGRAYGDYVGADPKENHSVAPTWGAFDQDPVYCVCHGSQYDPMLLTVNVNERNGARYVGAARVHGPAPRALPVIPVRAAGQTLVGGMANPAWYVYC
jgi:Rieske Fe-S protein